MAQSRREFIRIGGAGLGAAAPGSGLTTNWWGLDPDVVHDPGTDGDRVVPTFCELCFWKCGVLAHVKDGRVTKIVGNPEHPLSNGKLCPRGTGGTGLLYDPDRLKKPLLRRKGKRGDQTFEEVSWEKALDFTAEKLLKIKKEYGPEKVALFSHGFGGSFFKHLLFAYGSANVTAPSYGQCRGPRDVGFDLTFGAGVGSPEVARPRELARASRSSARTSARTCTTPRCRTSPPRSRRARPSSSSIRASRRRRARRVLAADQARHRHGAPPRLDARDRQRGPLRPRLRRDVRDRPRGARSSTSRTRRPSGRSPRRRSAPNDRRDGARHRRRAARVARPPRAAHHLVRRRHAARPRRRHPERAPRVLGPPRRDLRPDVDELPKYPVPAYAGSRRRRRTTRTASCTRSPTRPLARRLRRDGPGPIGKPAYPIKGWIVYGTNLCRPCRSARTSGGDPGARPPRRGRRPPGRDRGYADVVLPEATYLERWDDVAPVPWSEPFLALRQPVVPPLYETKPGWWIAKELAKRLDLGAYFPWQDAEPMVAERLKAGGYDFAALKATGVVQARVPVTTEEGLELSFATPSKKIELYSKRMADAGLPPLPALHATRQPAAGPVPPALRPGARPHVRPHHEQPLPLGGLRGERGLAEREGREGAGARERREGRPRQPGRRAGPQPAS